MTKKMVMGFLVSLFSITALGAAPQDYAKTHIGAVMGVGQFVYGEDTVQINFVDVSIYGDYRFSSIIRMGARGSFAHDSKEGTSGSLMSIGPYISADWRLFGLFTSIYIIRGSNSATAGDGMLPSATLNLRIGSKNSFYFSLHLFDTWPVYSGGGWLRLGLGLKPLRSTSLWLGMGTFPQAGPPGLVVSLEQQLTRDYDLYVGGRYGSSDAGTDYAVSLGVTYHLYR